MQYSFKALALVAIAGLAIADVDPVTGIDTCAKECLDKGATGPTVGCKSPQDYACLCTEKAQSALLTAVGISCVVPACTLAKVPAIQQQAADFCKKVNAGGLNTSAAPEPTSAAPKPTTSAEPETTSEEPLSSTSLTPYPTSSPVVVATTAVGTAAPTGSVPTSSLPPFQGGAAQAAAGAGSIFAAGLALLAAF